jgi:NAD(P)-dependent dehydrogenase (short-subunit alcohol dehydrogenase family)
MLKDSWIKGKTCMITGANTGIGKETARQIAALGAHVIMVCRNQEKGEQAKEDIIQTTDNKNVELLICDLASLKDVKRFADQFLQTHNNLHILINNAGVFHMKRTTTQDGYESTFAVNYLAHFYLTELLLPLLKKSSPSRIINLSSNIHKSFKIKMKDPFLEKGYLGPQAYSNSKTAMVLFTNKLVRELEGTEVTANSVNPGHVKTQMTTVGLSKWFRKFADIILPPRTIEHSAKTSVYVASSNDLEGISGKYFTDCKESKTAKMTNNILNQDFLWDLSKRLVTEALAKQD